MPNGKFEQPPPEKPLEIKEEEKMETKKQEVTEQKWQKTVDKAMAFLGTCLELDGLTGEINKEELLKKDLEKLQRLEEILGENVIKYLGHKEVSSITELRRGIPRELAEEELRQWRKEDSRIRGLNPEELRQEADKHVAEMREKEEETKKRK